MTEEQLKNLADLEPGGLMAAAPELMKHRKCQKIGVTRFGQISVVCQRELGHAGNHVGMGCEWDSSRCAKQVVVNGESMLFDGQLISYELLASHVKDQPHPSITWYLSGTSEGGTLSPGKSVIAHDGMVFNVMNTGRA